MKTVNSPLAPNDLNLQSWQEWIYVAAGMYRFKTGKALKFAVYGMAVCLTLVAISCAVGGQKMSEEVTRTFETYQVLPDHRYYQIGWDTRIHAIAALKKPYHITGELWQEFEANPETLKKRVDALEIWNERGYDRVSGYYFFDKSGNRIGAWYSSIYVFTATTNYADSTVVISMDKPWVTP